jgi:hypothetical protein
MGRPPVDSEQLRTRVERSVIDALDAFAASEPDRPTRPEAIRRILTADLQRRGFLHSTGAPNEGKRPDKRTRPDELNSTNDD